MSLVLYHNGQLAGDRLGRLFAHSHLETCEDMQKIFVNDAKTIAIGYCGNAVDSASIFAVMEILKIRMMSREAELSEEGFLNDAEVDWGPINKLPTSMIAMTHTQAWHFDNVKDKQFTDITDARVAMGNGSYMGYVCLAHGLTPHDAVIEVSKLSTDVGYGVDSVKMSDLKPLNPAVKRKPTPRRKGTQK
jgi:hypothetical protein